MGSRSEEQARLEKMGKLCVALRELQAKEYEIVEEMARLAGGAAGIADTLKRLEGAFDSVWCARYAPGLEGQYIWQFARDVPALKKLLKSLTVEEIERRMFNYLKSPDPFFGKNRHPFRLFVASINQFAAFDRRVDEESQPPADCKHEPPCPSDQEHTRRRNDDMRGGGESMASPTSRYPF